MLTEEHLWLMLWLFVWLIVVYVVVRNQWNQKKASAGLPLIYLLTLSMIHWFGALIYAFPWYKPTSDYLMSQDVSIAHVLAGFNQSVYGAIGFGIGSTLLAPWVLKEIKPAWLSEVSRPPDLKLPKTYISIGLFICVAIAPILLGVPGLSAITTSGVALFIVGLCLACWKSWYLSDRKAFLTWLVIACSMPLITVFTLGFIGYGAVASLVVLIFVFNFYRPRWKVVVTGLLLLVLGLSVFVNYMRDRVEIRATVWGGQSGQTRIERLWQTVTTFELFDPFKQEHLEAIDARLNQNTLIGQTVNQITAGFVDYAHGKTLEQAAIAAIPRLLWPDKPVRAGSPEIVSRYTGIEFADGTSVGVGQVMEFYINFGSTGVLLGFVVYGTLLRIIDMAAGKKLVNGNWSGFASWFLPGLGLIQPGGSLVEVVASTSASIVLVYFLNKFYQSKTKRGQALSVNRN